MQDAVCGRWVKPCFFTDFLECDSFFACGQNVHQCKHAFQHLHAGFVDSSWIVFLHMKLPSKSADSSPVNLSYRVQEAALQHCQFCPASCCKISWGMNFCL